MNALGARADRNKELLNFISGMRHMLADTNLRYQHRNALETGMYLSSAIVHR